MKSLFKCEMNYIESKHLSQLYAGFEILQNRGIAEISLRPGSGDFLKPILRVRVNNKFDLLYDTMDGLNWVDGDLTENLNYFRNNFKADFYFKRSFVPLLVEHAPDNCKVYPLGLNYNIAPKRLHKRNMKDRVKNAIRNNHFISNHFKINDSDIFSEKFEHYPIPNKTNKVLFLTRLWDPSEVKQEVLQTNRDSMNKFRIQCIRLCQQEFGAHFIGGIQMDQFSISECKDLAIPYSLSRREVYLKTLKESNICIATTGLHHSMGFKLGEYVAASRAIVSEPLHYKLPGEFQDQKNYYSFTHTEELIRNIYRLMGDQTVMRRMMNNNFQYYHTHLRPDVLVLNSLLMATMDD